MSYFKKLLVLICIFFQNGIVQAQIYGGVDAAYFLTSIINQNNFGSQEMDYEFSGNPSFGLSIGYAGYNKHHIQTGIKFLNLGQKYSSELNNLSYERLIEMNYIMIPLSYKLVFGDTESNSYATRAFFSVGTYLSFLNQAETTWTIGRDDVSLIDFHSSQNPNGDILQLAQLANGSDLEDEKDYFESIDYGVTLSFGVRTFLGEGLALNLEILGGYGLGDINAEEWRLNNSVGEYDPSNNTFGGVQMGIHYYFGL